MQQLAPSTEQQTQLRSWLDGLDRPCLDLIEQARPPACPHCGCPRSHRYGQANGLRRFRCTRCRRSYNALTGTPLARLRQRGKWLPYLECLLESTSVRKAARKVSVHPSTSFRWRHRFLSGIRRDRAEQLTGIVEADETYLLESQKGSRHLTRPARRRGGRARRRGISRDLDCLLVAHDRTRQTLDFVTGRGTPGKAELDACLRPVLAPDVLLISDGAKAYVAFARDARIAHASIDVRAGIRARGTIHLQNVNGWHGRFKNWLVRFRGVASRYLIHYSGWQRVLDAGVLSTPALLLRAALRRTQQ
ncbi:IS1595 family transposase [Massilia niastensis]|uniref:IS1595 family transposase n=1 Tax=Massilia niastensis TaxID=544911 RepID=UPI000372E6C1